MKKITACILLCLFISPGFSVIAQSNSFQAFGEKFSDEADVHHFSTNGFFARTILWMAGEHEFNNAVKSIKSINLITVPKSAFEQEKVTVSGFKKVLKQDSFDELARVKDNGDDVTLYIRSTETRNNRYMILIEQSATVILIELKGYVDPDFLLNNRPISFSENKQRL